MVYNKKTIIKLILLALILISGSVFFGINDNQKSIEEKILIQAGDIYQNVALPLGEISQPSPLERNDFSEFVGLPGKEDREFYENYSLIYSEDNNKVAIVSFIDSEENKDKRKEFICELSEKKCHQEKLFFNEYNLDSVAIMDSSMRWLGWNSKNSMVIGLLIDDINSETLYVCDITTKSCHKNVESKLIFPNGAVNKSLDKVVAIKQNDIINEKTGDQWELFLYDINNLAKPIKSYNISQAINKDEDLIYDGVNSISWSNDNKTILIGTLRNIFKFDLEKDSLKKIFTDVSAGESDTYWNSDYIQFSPSERYAVFVDTIVENTAEEDANSEEEVDNEEGVLKVIDLKNENKVIEVFQAKDLILK